MTTVAVMQPYFVPYAGYFRIFAVADVVVMLDSVQFPRRGWVHRNRFALASGITDWLTLTLDKPAFDALISDLRFAADAQERLMAAVPRFPALARAAAKADALLARSFNLGAAPVAEYLVEQVGYFARQLGFGARIERASALGIDPNLHGQDRIIEIARRFGATRYVNPAGGRALYDAQAFAAANMELMFFEPYGESMDSILTRLLVEPAAEVAGEIVREAAVTP